MKNIIIKAVALTLTVILTLLFIPFSASGYELYNYTLYSNLDNVMLLNNENQVYLVGSNNNTVYIDSIYNNQTCTTLTLDNKVSYVNLCNDTFVFMCYVKSIDQTQVVLYNIYTDSFSSFNLNSDLLYMNTQAVYADNRVYLADCNGKVKIYSVKGKFVNEFDLNTNLSSLICDFYGNVYALTERGAFYINASNYKRISNDEFYGVGRFINQNTFSSNFGSLYSADASSVTKLFEHNNNVSFSSGAIFNNYAITFNNNVIYAFDINSGVKKKNYKLSDSIEQLFAIDDTIIVLYHDGYTPTVVMLDFSQLKDVKSNSIDDHVNSDDNYKEGSISSDVYNVDFENNKIYGINSPTTVAKFKSNMNYDGYNLTLYRYNKSEQLKSGNVGTATLAVFYNDSSRYEFELCIAGDLTGEGNVNTRDEDAMFDYLLDNVSFTGVFLDASDLNNSGEIKVEDLVLLLRLIEKQK